MQVTVAFPAVPGIFPEIFRIKINAAFVCLLVGYHVVEKIELDLGAGVVIDPSVRRIQVLPAVIVEIGEGRSPEPAGRVRIGFFGDVLEGSVAFIAQQGVP